MKTIINTKINFVAIVTWVVIAFISALMFNAFVNLSVYILYVIFNV
jgi:hypothetical protein